jgi:exopolysaccharide biosynthesis polyprenyl glycosylphosphotransferase
VRWYAALLVTDTAMICLGFALPAAFLHAPSSWPGVVATTLPIYFITATSTDAYALSTIATGAMGIKGALRALAFAFLALFLTSYFLRAEQDMPRAILAVTMASATILLIAGRLMLFRMMRARARQRPIQSMMVIIDRLDTGVPQDVEYVDAQAIGLVPDLRDPAMLHLFAHLIKGVDRVVVSCLPEARERWAMLLKGANVRGEVVAAEVSAVGALGVSGFAEQPTLIVSGGPLNTRDRIVKRMFDLAFCVPALVALAPLLLFVAVAIKLDSRGPVLFRQKRVGRGNALFEIFKFRSMYTDNCDTDGSVSTRRNDARITRVGRFIRSTSIDELPQLFNVLLGSMSVVGPRPHALGSLAEDQLFWDIDERYWHRHAIKPGITGLAQVRGLRGATVRRSDLTDRLQADLEYVNGWSWWRDVTILVSTLRVVVGHNTY